MKKETKEVEKLPYEFLLYINGNIICQRFFNIKGFNYESVNSLELKEVIDDATNLIYNHLKEKSEDFLWRNFNPYVKQELSEIDRRNIYENEDFFDFEIKISTNNGKRKSIGKKRFSGNVFPPKVRYSVDIREIIPYVISTIQMGLSKDKYNKVLS